jgi:hypothetical protein
MEEHTKAELQTMYDDLLRRYNSLVAATQALELREKALIQENGFLTEQLENAELNISQQKTNLINVVTTSNATKDQMAKEIAELKGVIKNGNHNHLGN